MKTFLQLNVRRLPCFVACCFAGFMSLRCMAQTNGQPNRQVISTGGVPSTFQRRVLPDGKLSGIINEYFLVQSFDPCTNRLTVVTSGDLEEGDLVLLMQMKGAVIDSSNTSSFGKVISYGNAGNYEFNYVKHVAAQRVTLLNQPGRSFSFNSGLVQLVRVPSYKRASIVGSVRCKAWDGLTGGVLAIDVEGSLTLYGDIDVSGLGFRGGKGVNSKDQKMVCSYANYFYGRDPEKASEKGEGIAGVSAGKSYGKGAPANGGGGGNAHNAGGGGGANGGSGGVGGGQITKCSGDGATHAGCPGGLLSYDAGTNRLFAGGGGGAAHANDNFQATTFNPNGGDGGGIVIVRAHSLECNGGAIRSNGLNGTLCTQHCSEGGGGGGAGGTVVLDVQVYLSKPLVEVKGGDGSYVDCKIADLKIGAGGGGGGGVLVFCTSATVFNDGIVLKGGLRGLNQCATPASSINEPGKVGVVVKGYVLAASSVLFGEVSFIRLEDTLVACRKYLFTGEVTMKEKDVTGDNGLSWTWAVDQQQLGGKEVQYEFKTAGKYPVKLTVHNNGGCLYTAMQDVVVTGVTAWVRPDTLVCWGAPVTLQASGGAYFAWTPVSVLTNAGVANPVAHVDTTTTFHVTISDSVGCEQTAAVTVFMRDKPNFRVLKDTSVCVGGQVTLFAGGGDVYEWTPASGLSDAHIAQPVFNLGESMDYVVRIRDTVCGQEAALRAMVRVNLLPVVKLSKSGDVDCSNAVSVLNAQGADTYSWWPATGLGSASGSSVSVMPVETKAYYVSGTDGNGCTGTDSIVVKADLQKNRPHYEMPNGFTPNNDGVNDRFGIKYWGGVQSFHFDVFNQWGQKVFSTSDPAQGWDGMVKGAPAGTGNYVYMIRAVTTCGAVERNGSVVLMR